MRHPNRGAVLVPLIVLGGSLLWTLWPVLGTMAGRWSGDPRYSHGYFVPIFALALLLFEAVEDRGVGAGDGAEGVGEPGKQLPVRHGVPTRACEPGAVAADHPAVLKSLGRRRSRWRGRAVERTHSETIRWEFRASVRL
jgi:hypothetical protein